MTDRRRLLTLTIIALFASLSPLPSGATETCGGGRAGHPIHVLEPGDDDSGIGGTGFGPDDSGLRGTTFSPDDSGLGGTGFGPDESSPARGDRMQRTSGGDDDDSGIGGTGRGPVSDGDGPDDAGPAPRGLGLFGRAEPVGRGSADPEGGGRGRRARVCVSGVEVVIPESLALESSSGADGQGVPRSLASGQLVLVEAVRTADGVVARRIVVARDGAGRIERRDEDGTLVVDGRRLRLRESTTRSPSLDDAELAPGRWIAFQAQLGPDGELVATRIAPGRAGETRAPDTAFEATLAARLLEARREGRIDYASVEGFVGGREARPRIGRLELAVPEDTPDAIRRAIRPGARLRVGGRIESDGVLRVMPTRPAPSRPGPMGTRPTDQPPRPDAIPERPKRRPRDEVGPPPRPMRPKAARDLQRPAVRPRAPALDRRLAR
ncbi:MAG: DUF5666 domain-containing protein [bacterium]|nr:DUF5666 domain-containing protein [bacterium]